MHELLQGPQRATEVDDRQLQRNVESHGRPPIKLRWTLAAIMIPAVGLGVWLWLSQTVQPPTTTSAMIAASPPPTSPQQQKPTAHNGANAYLLSLDLAARAQTLGKVVGEGCSGKSTFYMGIGTSGFAKNEAFWSVRCQDGRTYAVETHPDGTSSVLECSVLKTMHAGECFKKLSN
jgi:hypothetical protein